MFLTFRFALGIIAINHPSPVMRKQITRVFFALLVAFLAAGTLLFWRGWQRVPPTVEYRYNEDGRLEAKAWVPGGKPLPCVRTVDVTVWEESFIWTGHAWERQNIVSSAEWGPTMGGRVVVKVPETKWKVELWTVPQSELRIGSLSFRFPPRTNLVFSAEGPGRPQTIEAELIR